MFYNDLQTKMPLPTKSRPTCVVSSSCTLIDSIFVNNLNNFKWGFSTIIITGQFPIFIKNDNYFSTDKLAAKQNKFDIDLFIILLWIVFIINLAGLISAK